VANELAAALVTSRAVGEIGQLSKSAAIVVNAAFISLNAD
jgi:hypothetical protein